MHVLHVISGLGAGGAEAVLHRLVLHDKRAKHTIISLSPNGKYFELFHQANIIVLCFDRRDPFTSLLRIFIHITRSRPTIIQTWMYHADFVGTFLGLFFHIPVVWGIRNNSLDPTLHRTPTLILARLCAIFSYIFPAQIVICSESALQTHYRFGYNGKLMLHIPNGYNLSQHHSSGLDRKSLRRNLSIPSGVPLIINVARLDPVKDHKCLIAALAHLRDKGHTFKCLLVGSGTHYMTESLRKLISSLSLSDSIILYGPSDDIPSLFYASDLHVLSSLSESFPNVLAEAMSCCVPCVTTDVGDAASIVGDTGWVVPPSNPYALSEAIEQAFDKMSDLTLWSRLKSRCRQHIASNFSIDNMLDSYHRVWQSAISSTSF